MRNGIRTGWLVAGGVLSVVSVLTVALSAWFELRLPHRYDFAYPGSYDSSVIGTRTSDDEVTVVRSFVAPWVIVDVTGRIGVRVVPGTADRLSVSRKAAVPRVSHEINETWENGKTLRIRLECPETPSCLADYTLGVPPGVQVIMAAPSGKTAPCPLSGPETICRAPDPERHTE
ncbi:hypothetical protein [Streptosporangium sp. NPDC051022]|uniref:hypothetical protein n=1 Tax=Streptosporangium sp. NPDC051022 TaxID=3155752 RepID=UPI003444D7A1